MVRAIYSDKKGIYRDLYRTINADNQKEKNIKRQRKGIYVNLYIQIEDDKQNISFKNNRKEKRKLSFLIAFHKIINQISPRIPYVFSSTTHGLKVLTFSCMVAKQPINYYIEKKLPVYQRQECQGFYYNDR